MDPLDKKTLTMTIDQAAGLLQLHPETLRRAYRRGDLKAVQLGKRAPILIAKRELESWWERAGGGKLFYPSLRPRELVRKRADYG